MKSKTNRQGNPLTFRASKDEKQRLQDAAKKLGTTRGALVRSAALAVANELLAANTLEVVVNG